MWTFGGTEIWRMEDGIDDHDIRFSILSILSILPTILYTGYCTVNTVTSYNHTIAPSNCSILRLQ